MADLIERDKAIDTLQMDISIIPYVKAREYANAVIETIYNRLKQLSPAQPEITDEQAIEHLQDTGWMQNHDHEMYMMGIRERLADDSGSYDSLIPAERITEDDVIKWCHDRNLALITKTLYLEMIKRWSVSAQPEQKVGKWIRHENEDGEPYGHNCSICGEWYVMPYGKTKFCPNCGAKMEEQDADGT